MNAKTDRWEMYTDKAGRRHWRWPASGAHSEQGRDLAFDARQQSVTPAQQQQAHFAPLPARGKQRA
jgi:hypothetical protein